MRMLKKPAVQESVSSRNFYLTKEGREKIKKEYEALLKIRNSMRSEGPPSIFHSEELNPEYLSYLEDADLLETKISEAEYILKYAKIVKNPPLKKRSEVNLGAKVFVESSGRLDEFNIVGTLEANPVHGRISNESPVGKALLGHKVGDAVLVSDPVKTIYKIKKIRYLGC